MSSPVPAGSVPPSAVLGIGERLTEAPSERLIAVAFARELQAQQGLTKAMGWVDLAHTITLAEGGIIPRDSAHALIAALCALNAAPLSFAPAAEYGDLYTNREAWLGERTSAVGWLGAGRARREALTTAYHLVLCEQLLDLGSALAAAAEALIVASVRYRDSLMPDYTYLQAAQPTTFGHYLQTFAWPILRDLDRLWGLYGRVDHCPAGIGSSNGAVIMQNRQALSDRLGFRAPVRHARDAMWQADLAIEASALAVSVAVNLDRLAEDLMIFATAEFGFVRLADRHARASKVMPHKRNPFALSFVRAAANRLIGAQAGIAAAGRTPSGQMDNRLFVYEAAPDAVRLAGEIALLSAECVESLTFGETHALAALNDRSVCASDLVERLMAATGIDYRAAHGVVGGLVQALEENGRTLAKVTADDLRTALTTANHLSVCVTEDLIASALNPSACVSARKDVGGAAPEEVTAMSEALAAAIGEHRHRVEAARTHRDGVLFRLLAEAEKFLRDTS
jgi:argininosuccinate lyase